MTLTYLRVENIGLITDATLELSPGLTVITGETGSGKTLLLGGIRLVTGERAETGLVGPAGDRALVEAVFEDEGSETAVSRTVPASGKSRAHVDGVLVSLGTMAERISPKVEMVGQHDQLSLRRPSHILELVDASGGHDHAGLVRRYGEAWDELRQAEDTLDMLGGDEMKLRRELDLVNFQAGEIGAAGLEPDEVESLEIELSRLRNLDEITAHLADSLDLLDRMSEDGGEVVARIRKVVGLDPDSTAAAEQAEGVVEALREMSRSISSMVDGLDPDPGRLEFVEQRLNLIGEMRRKYGRTLVDVLDFGDQARARAEEIEQLLERRDQIDEDLARARQRLAGEGEQLSASRRVAAAALEEAIVGHLEDLGLDTPRVEFRFEEVAPGPSGQDRVDLWFTSDRELPLARVGVGASGGELSRLVLAVSLAANVGSEATLVFDEVDTGIGGVTALAMGRKLADLSSRRQVLCVTHLPQVAAHADTHYVVEREGRAATTRAVTGEQRIAELARMLAGLPESDAGLGAAQELLAVAGRGGAEEPRQ